MPANSSYTRANAVSYVRDNLHGKGTAFYTDSYLQRCLAAAYRQWCIDGRWYLTFGTENSVEDQFEYGWPDCIFEIKAISYDGQYLPKRHPDWLMRRNPKWRSAASGTPALYMLFPQTRYGLFPAPDADDETIRVEGYGIPTVPTTDGGFYKVITEWEDLPLDLAAHYASLKDIGGTGQLQLTSWGQHYARKIEEMKAAVHGHEDTVVGEDMEGFGPTGLMRPLTTIDFGGVISGS
jgi:hypothetical protein